jgi:hypothetical protein
MFVTLEDPFGIKYKGTCSCVRTETIKALIGCGNGGPCIPDLALEELNRYLRLRSAVFQLTANQGGPPLHRLQKATPLHLLPSERKWGALFQRLVHSIVTRHDV